MADYKKSFSIDDSDAAILKMYYNRINKISLLTKGEEQKLVALAQKGDMVAREKLINSHLRFVVRVAREFRNRGLPLAD